MAAHIRSFKFNHALNLIEISQAPLPTLSTFTRYTFLYPWAAACAFAIEMASAIDWV